MRTKYLLIALTFIVAGCSNNSTAQNQSKATTPAEKSGNTPTGNWEKLQMTSFRDNEESNCGNAFPFKLENCYQRF